MTYRSTLLEAERGLTWSFALTVTGLPDTFTDGMASWASFSGGDTERVGCLYNRDFNIDMRADPLKPLTTGGELSFQLGDDGTGEVYLLFAPGYSGPVDYINDSSVAGDDLTITMGSGTVIAAANYAYAGSLETVLIDNTAGAPTVDVERAKFGTLGRAIRTSGQYGTQLTTSPVSFSGRLVSLYAAPVNSSTGAVDLDHMGKIWAGTIKLVRQQGAKIELQCAPLGALLETDWPPRMPSGQIKSGGTLRYVSEGHWSKGLELTYARNRPSDATFIGDQGTLTSPIYKWDGSYAIVEGAAGMFPLAALLQYVQDTINYIATNNTDYPFQDGVNRTLVNSLTLDLAEREAHYEVWMNSRSALFSGRIKAFGFDFEIRQGRHRVLKIGKETGIGKSDTQIPVLLDHPAYTFELSYKEVLGAARISDGSEYEVVTFTGVTTNTDDPRRITLTGVTRGFDGRKPQAWGVKKDDEDEPKGAEITQLLFAHEDAGIAPEELVCALLLSTETLYQQGSTDFWTGYRQCLGIPIQFVDVEGITRTFKKIPMERINSFWVDEAGKGKKSLEELMKFYGAFFVTKQFVRGGTTYFGLSVDTVDTPTRTFYQDEITDADRQSGTEPIVDHNERLVINQVTAKPFDRVYAKNGDEASPIYVYDELSIARHGAQKALEISPTIFDRQGRDAVRQEGFGYEGRAAQGAIVLESALRWFSAFGRGNYKLSMTIPAPVGWRIYPGLHVLVDLTGVRNPQGGPNLSQVPARIYNVIQRWGTRGGCDLDARLSFDAHCELAPSARVLSATSTTITLDANYFTAADTRGSFEDVEEATDADWFDPARYGGDIYCEIWSEGLYNTTVANFRVTARSGNVLTVNTDLTALDPIVSLPGTRAIIGFREYDNTNTAFQTSFAHLADNGNPPTLGGDSDSPKVYG